MVKKILLGIVLLLLIVLASQFSLIYYGWMQAKGQIKIIWEAKPIEEFLSSSDYPDSLKLKLKLIQEVKAFAFEQLGINNSKNYSSLYDQKGQPIMWVVTACEPFALAPKNWTFPLLGSVPYKGFFNPAMAEKEATLLRNEGYDVGVRNPGGWSTLGWFNDPILSEMLTKNHGQLAELIIHELTHSTIFVKDSVTFNENLASFIGRKGAVLFLQSKYGEESSHLEEYLREEKAYDQIVHHFINGANLLDSLYSNFSPKLDESEKIKKKQWLILNIMNNMDTLTLFNVSNGRTIDDELPNNTYFMSFLRYRSKQTDFDKEFYQTFDGNLKNYITYYKLKHPFL